jgi:hypothetical protein
VKRKITFATWTSALVALTEKHGKMEHEMTLLLAPVIAIELVTNNVPFRRKSVFGASTPAVSCDRDDTTTIGNGSCCARTIDRSAASAASTIIVSFLFS